MLAQSARSSLEAASGTAAAVRLLKLWATGLQVAQVPLQPRRIHSPSESSSASLPLPLTGQPRDAGSLFSRSTLDPVALRPTLAGRFYQRSLPSSQVTFTSEHGRQLFREALAEGTLENFFHLAEQFRTQDEPTFCGLTTLAMVLNSLRIDPMRTWKGVWRWFSEQNLACCASTSEVRENGLSFDMFRCLAGCNGADVVAQRAPTAQEVAEDPAKLVDFLKEFRRVVKLITSSQDRESLVVSYSRESLGQSGAGHFSPIGGYHEGEDRVLILDVARFKYPPHWARVEDVVRAMTLIDPDTGKSRGFLTLRLQQQAAETARPTPLRVPFVPAAAGRRLSEALHSALVDSALSAERLHEKAKASGASLSPADLAIRRWLAAVSKAEPHVIKQLLQVGDAGAIQEVFARLAEHPLFAALCVAYQQAIADCCSNFVGEFPAMRFLHCSLNGTACNGVNGSSATASQSGEVDIGLGCCGELWVLLLVLFPDHVRAAVSPELAGPSLPKDVAKVVRGPWALPLEVLRDALAHLVPAPQIRPCSARKSRKDGGY